MSETLYIRIGKEPLPSPSLIAQYLHLIFAREGHRDAHCAAAPKFQKDLKSKSLR
jgi:hypothetical protein